MSDGSSKITFSTPFCISTSKPSWSASGISRRLSASRASSLFRRNSCSVSEGIERRRSAAGDRELVGGGEVAAAGAGAELRLLHAHGELVHLVVELHGREADDVLAVQLL